jgi:5'(3')-deoxyribonucleotidase
MIIGIDMDDTVFDFIPSVLKKYNETYQDNELINADSSFF